MASIIEAENSSFRCRSDVHLLIPTTYVKNVLSKKITNHFLHTICLIGLYYINVKHKFLTVNEYCVHLTFFLIFLSSIGWIHFLSFKTPTVFCLCLKIYMDFFSPKYLFR